MKNPFRRPKPTKQQLLQQQKLKEQAERGKQIVREVLYPILHEHATTINNAERMAEIFKTIIMMAMQKPFKDKKVSDLDFVKELEDEKDDKSKVIFKAFLDGFKDVPISEAIRVLNEFEGGVQAYFQEQGRTREFKSLTLEDLIGK